MTDEELAELLRQESDRVERKAALSGDRVKNEVGQAICAFSNDLPNHRLPGVIVIVVVQPSSAPPVRFRDRV